LKFFFKKKKEGGKSEKEKGNKKNFKEKEEVVYDFYTILKSVLRTFTPRSNFCEFFSKRECSQKHGRGFIMEDITPSF